MLTTPSSYDKTSGKQRPHPRWDLATGMINHAVALH